MTSSDMKYINLCSRSIRRDQQPSKSCLSGSGLPIPSKGLLEMDSNKLAIFDNNFGCDFAKYAMSSIACVLTEALSIANDFLRIFKSLAVT